MANAYDAILNQYRNKTTQTKTKKSGSFDLTRYFSTFLPEGVNSGTKRIRILPSAVEGESPFVTMAIHSMKVDGKYPKMICPEKEDGTDCPLCETRKTLYAANTEATIEAAKKYGSKDMYAIRVIDRDKEGYDVGTPSENTDEGTVEYKLTDDAIDSTYNETDVKDGFKNDEEEDMI